MYYGEDLGIQSTRVPHMESSSEGQSVVQGPEAVTFILTANWEKRRGMKNDINIIKHN